MSAASSDSRASASVRVIDPTSFNQRLERALITIRDASDGGGTGARNVDALQDAERIRTYMASGGRPAGPIHPGWRGAASARLKVQIRRLIYWYVDPMFDVQQNNSHLLSEQVAVQAQIITDLRREVDELQGSLTDLRRFSARLQQTSRSAMRRAECKDPSETNAHESTVESN